MKLKENSFIISLSLFPFLLILIILKCNNILQNSFYNYLILAMGIILVIAYIYAFFFAIDEILNSQNKERIRLLLIFPLIYLPIYYTKYIYNDEKYFGYGAFVLNILLIIGLYFSIKGVYLNYTNSLNKENIILNTTYSLMDRNKRFAIPVTNNYTCTNDLGDYVISCDNNSNDSFLGIYSYNNKSFNQGEFDNILLYHMDLVFQYIEEKGYSYDIVETEDLVSITYNDMVVMIKEKVYNVKDESNCLIIIMEVPIKNQNIEEFENIIKSIQFLE